MKINITTDDGELLWQATADNPERPDDARGLRFAAQEARSAVEDAWHILEARLRAEEDPNG